MSDGFASYYTAARLVAEGANISQFYNDAWFGAQIASRGIPVRDIFNPNVPTTALLFAPLTPFDYITARIIWTMFNALLFAGTLALLLYEAGLRGVWVPGAVILALLYQPLYASFNQGQAYVLVFALMVAAWWAYRRGCAALLGLILALLLLGKTAGALFWPLLLARRRRALAWSAAFTFLLALVSLPRIGAGAWLTFIDSLRIFSAHPSLAVTAYQSQSGFFRHLFTFDPQWNPAPLVNAPILGTWLPLLGFVVVVSVSMYVTTSRPSTTDDRPSTTFRLPSSVARLALAARRLPSSVARLALTACRRLSFVVRPSSFVPRPPSPVSRPDLAFAMFTSANIILSPMSLDYHYTTLLLPIIVLVTWARNQDSGWVWAALALAVTLIAANLPYRAAWLSEGAWAFLAYPKLYGALLLWGIAGWELVGTCGNLRERVGVISI
jgi:hypothetical protein